ncbi:MAG: hypothetical protein KDE19_16695, partial [Caldilineaceae bacterium]|nr:hypothetical protein [Caldilineaceae bacterium]
PGSYTIRVSAYAFTDASGVLCDRRTVAVTVVQSRTTPTPTTTATPPPLPTVTPTPSATATTAPGDTCVGDQTWLDQDEDGIHDSGEPGLSGMDLYLWADDNRDGLPDRIVGTTTSGADGRYAFCGLQAVQIYMIEFGTTPQCSFTLRDQGNDETVDSDVDTQRGLTAPLQLANGQINNAVDAGYICGSIN